MAEFTYMGTKKALATQIAEACDLGTDGPLLELFSGLSAVGRATQGSRPIWCNDVQKFSNLYCEVLFGLKSSGGDLTENWGLFVEKFEWHLRCLTDIFGKYSRKENRFLSSEKACEYGEWSSVAFDEVRKLRPKATRRELSHLFTTTYALGYWGLDQAMQADSIRWSIDWLASEKKISTASHKLSILALCKALANGSNSTGHFAQYLSPNARNFHRVRQKRRVEILTCFQSSLGEITPMGSRAWRRKNRVFSQEAVDLARSLSVESEVPDVVYADPPYTDDQYSRYYHVLESAVLYDYPEISGAGRYRQNRFSSNFSLASRVEGAFESLIRATSELGSSLVISYPDNGLLNDSTEKIPDLMSRYYSNVRQPITIDHTHSTMGGSKGPHKQQVNEQLFIAHR